MIYKTKELHAKGMISDNPHWLPEIFRCQSCEDLFYVLSKKQRETELCLACGRDKAAEGPKQAPIELSGARKGVKGPKKGKDATKKAKPVQARKSAHRNKGKK